MANNPFEYISEINFADEFDMTGYYMYLWMRYEPLPVFKEMMAWKIIRSRRDYIVRRAYAQGISKNAIARSMGIARTTVDRILR